MTNYAKYIDHTLLAMDATYDQIQKICDEAIKHEFYSVCVNSSYVPFVAKKLAGSPVKTCSVIGFPLGAMLTNAKAFETQAAIHEGAQEIDMVINVGWLKSGKWQEVENDIQSVYTACNGTPLKVIIETCLLTQDEIVKVCEICKKINVAFVKTSTGFSQSGAKKEDVELMKKTVGSDIQVKASGGVRTQETADIMIKAGATRLGTSSGIAIISGNNTSTQSY